MEPPWLKTDPQVVQVNGKYYKVGSRNHRKEIAKEAKSMDSNPKKKSPAKRATTTPKRPATCSPSGGHRLGGEAGASKLLEMYADVPTSSSSSSASSTCPPATTTAAATVPHRPIKRFRRALNPEPELNADDLLNVQIEISDESQGQADAQADESQDSCVFLGASFSPNEAEGFNNSQ